MDMLEVDPKLFITCRLCLDEMGQYQILPKVQQHIKFCFDIEVQQFDGLPQLICKKCEAILSQYVATKQMFLEKQNSLKCRVKNRPPQNFTSEDFEAQQETVSSTQQTERDSDQNKSTELEITQSKVETKFEQDSTKYDQVSNENHDIIVKEHKSIRNRSWRLIYMKNFACKFCSKIFKDKKSINNHIKNHNDLIVSYSNVLNTSCFVKLERNDPKPNITGSKKYVVWDSEKVLQSKKYNYYILFTRKPDKETDVCSIISSDEEEIITKKKAKRQRLNSRSSNETVVIEHHDIKSRVTSDEEIDSNEISTNDSRSVKYEVDTIKLDRQKYANLNNIANTCFAKVLAKVQNDINPMYKYNLDKELQHKVLSMGQKILNHNGFNCIGLLRYMENKNLEINVIPKSQERNLNDSNGVRIRTKLKGKDNKYNTGWKAFDKLQNNNHSLHFSDILNKALSTATVKTNVSSGSTSERLSSNEKDPMVYYKLLNINPVANPKKCPKQLLKKNIVEAKSNILLNTPEIDSNNFETPKITSTVSLADQSMIPNENANNNLIIENLPSKSEVEKIKLNTQTNNNTQENSPTSEVEKIKLNTQTNTNTRENSPLKSEVEKIKLNTQTNTNTRENPPSKSEIEKIKLNTQTNTNTRENPPSKSEIEKIKLNTQTNIIHTPGNHAAEPNQIQRIKVKPFSELMPLNSINANNYGHNPNHCESPLLLRSLLGYNAVQSLTKFYTNQHPHSSRTNNTLPDLNNISNYRYIQPVQVYSYSNDIELQNRTENNAHEYIILHTVDLPNTKTRSPFDYLRKLLQIHNLILLESKSTARPQAQCLVKFRLQLQQEYKIPLTLCIALYCDIETIRIKVSNSEDVDIELNKLTVQCQWELIKSFKGEISDTILKNSIKHSNFMHTAKKLVLLIKSIQATNEMNTV